jgi:hypothetical protein
LPYHWNGLIFDSSGSKTAYLLNSKGCDSIATLNLNIISPIPNYLPTNGLVGWWPFNGNANDESGNGNNGTVNGATLTTDRNGNSGKAYSFDGVDDYIKTSNISFANNVDYTISLWVNLSVAYSSGYPQHYLISNAVLSNGAYLNTDYDENQFGCNSTFSTNTIGNWHHYLAVKSGNNYTLLIDNITIGTQSNCNTNFRNGFPLFFGNSSINTEFTNGKIDDIAIYNRALTQQEVTALYTGTNCTPTTSTTNISICPTALPYIWNGLTFNTAGSQTAHLTNAAGCDSAATLNLSFNAQPTPAANNVCVGGTIQLTNATSGGVWASVNNRATVNATGLVTGANAGGAVITYKKNGVTTNYNITVNAIPNVPSIVYAAGAINPQLGASRGAFCINKTFGIVGIPAGGVFTTGNNAIVTINCSGTVNTVGLGNSSINYRYTNAQGCSNSRTMTGMVVNCAARGVNTVEGQPSTVNDFTIYPNPAKLIVNLNIDCLVGAGSIVVTDLYGKIVKTQALSLGTNTIDIATLSKGMYFVSTITNEGKTTKKLVVE